MLPKKLFTILGHAMAGWAVCAAATWGAMRFLPRTAALIIHVASAPIFFAIVSWNYFTRFHHTSVIQTAAFFALAFLSLDFIVVAVLIQRSLAIFASPFATWIPLVLVFAATFLTGRWWEASKEQGTDNS